MHKAKKMLASMLCLAVVMATMLACGTTAFASSSTGEESNKIWAFYDGDFSSSWELYHSGDSGHASLTYGFNTFLIHEDYAWANHSTKTHHAYLATTNASAPGPSKGPGSVSKNEITHLSYENFYFCMY